MSRVKKSRRHRHAARDGDSRYGRTPAPGNAVLFPHVDSLNAPVSLALPLTPESVCDGCPAAERINQMSVYVLHDSGLNQNIFGFVKSSASEISSHDDPKGFWHVHEMARRQSLLKDEFEPSPAFKVQVGQRMRWLRIALQELAGDEVELKQFADDTGTDQDNLGNWERGVSLTPVLYIGRLRRTIGAGRVTFDWIYDDDPSGLRDDVRKKVADVRKRVGKRIPRTKS